MPFVTIKIIMKKLLVVIRRFKSTWAMLLVIRGFWWTTGTYLAGLGVDVPLTEELLDHSHVVVFLHSRKSSQHDGCVARFVLLVHTAHTCNSQGFTRGDLSAEGNSLHTDVPPSDLCPTAVWPLQSWSERRCSEEPCCRFRPSCWPRAPGAPTTPRRTPSGSRRPATAEPSSHWRPGTTRAGQCEC